MKTLLEQQGEKWMPEIGQECEVDHINQDEYVRCFIFGKSKTEAHRFIYQVLEGDYIGVLDDAVSDLFRPIQTQADKVREGQINALVEAFNCGRGVAENAYENGVRVLAPDEVPCKPLSDEQIKKYLVQKQGGFVSGEVEILRDFQRELKLIEG